MNNTEVGMFRKILLFTICILIVFVAIIGISYARNGYVVYGDKNNFSNSSLLTTYDVNSYNLNFNDFSDKVNKENLSYLDFDVLNNDGCNYSIYIKQHDQKEYDLSKVKVYLTMLVHGVEVPVTDVVLLNNGDKDFYLFSNNLVNTTYRIRYWSNLSSNENLEFDVYSICEG